MGGWHCQRLRLSCALLRGGVYYAASAFAQQEREIVPGQPLPLLLLVGNQEGSNTTAAVPSDFYNNPEAIGGDEVQMIAVTFSE